MAMARTSRQKLLLVVIAGTALRLIWAATTTGLAFDITSYHVAASALQDHGLRFYDFVNPPRIVRWPYPPGYLPWTLLSDALDPVVSFRFVVALPAIAADAALAFLVARLLTARGATENVALGAACIVAFGPIFALTSGFHGQIDSLAILPAVIALDRWSRGGGERAVVAGLLLGIAASIKGPAGIVVLALLPTVRSRSEAMVLVGAMVAVVGAALAPFALAEPGATIDALRFAGTPGEGGLSLLLQPDLSHLFVGDPSGVRASGLTLFLHDHDGALVAGLLLAIAAVARVRRAAPEPTAILLFLTVFVFGAGFAPRYTIWLLPILLLSGQLRSAVALQVALVGSALAVYAGPLRSTFLLDAYVVVGIATWVALACWWLWAVRALAWPADRRHVAVAPVGAAPAQA
jgi:uncharacterized membrane protein